MSLNTDKWQPVSDPDITKRWPTEWANIYGVKLIEPFDLTLMNEFEFAYNFVNVYNYIPIKTNSDGMPDWDTICDKELRANFLNRDIFYGDKKKKKALLKYRYVETQWFRNRFIRI